MAIKWRRVGYGALISLLLAVGACFADYLNTSINRGRAKATEAYMVRINTRLMIDQPQAVDNASIRALLHKYGVDWYYRDGWGHPFVIEAWKDHVGQFRHYRITSLGRSGRRSSCCKPRIGHDWDLNTVMQDGQWVQLWDF